MYKLEKNCIVRLSDSAFIPKNEKNPDYREYLKWLAEGNTPEPYVEPIPSYAELRAKEYPSIGDQLDAIWKIINGTEDEQSIAIKQAIITIKEKYPIEEKNKMRED